MPKVDICQQKIVEVLESKSPKSLSEIYRHLGGLGKLSGSTAKQMRSLVDGIDNRVANNKAVGSVKSEGVRESPKAKPPKKAGKKTAKVVVPRHPSNPFRPGGYATLVDLIANAGSKGVGKEDLLKAYSKASGKDETHCRYDLAVILSASTTAEKMHRSCRDGFTILREGDHLRIKFD